DNIVDFITWTVAPLFWLYATMQLPIWVLLACATASIFGFSNTAAKTDDHFFTGFPSYWNIVSGYLYLLNLTTIFALDILLLFSVTVFILFRFFYPTRPLHLRGL